MCSKFTGEHPCRSIISIIALPRGCFPENLLHIFSTLFPTNIYVASASDFLHRKTVLHSKTVLKLTRIGNGIQLVFLK